MMEQGTLHHRNTLQMAHFILGDPQWVAEYLLVHGLRIDPDGFVDLDPCTQREFLVAFMANIRIAHPAQNCL